MDVLRTRYELAKMLSYPYWADLATADQMIGSAANMKSFLDGVDKASKPAADHEYEMLLNFAKQKEPGRTTIPAYAGAYLYEQYSRSVLQFDSQSVRPYFPYDRVQQGILDTAAKLFHVTFKAAPDAPVWDP